MIFLLMLGHTTETITGALAVRNHAAVANAIGTGAATTGGTGHPGMTKWISFFSLVLVHFFSHHYHLTFSPLAAFQIFGTG